MTLEGASIGFFFGVSRQTWEAPPNEHRSKESTV